MPPGQFDIIALDRFVQATRDSGYRSTTSAIAELVDNSIQAEASRVSVLVRPSDDPEHPLEVLVIDDGSGMTSAELRQALRFGGSSRFGDRSGLGRYGMGLPNASLSQSRRVEVWSAAEGKHPVYSYLDVDEIAEGRLVEVPKPVRRRPPLGATLGPQDPGTVVAWTRCDRLDNKRVSTLELKISRLLGRMYRHFIWNGISIDVNGTTVAPIDPLYLDDSAEHRGAVVFEQPLEFEVRCRDGHDTSSIRVTFSELPVDAWHGLDNGTKRKMGIANGAGVSVVRGRREVDFGWFLMGGKRRENYDDWWRCEIAFEPELDEQFGITHTKQQIRPGEELREILEPSLERIAKILNGRVREAHTRLKSEAGAAPTEELATSRFAELKPLPARSIRQFDPALGERVTKKHRLKPPTPNGSAAPLVYRVVEDKLDDKSFFSPSFANGHALAVVNQRHPFYKHFYRKLQDGETIPTEQVRHALQVLLMAAVRAEGLASKAADREALAAFRRAWGEALAAAFDSVK